MPWTDDVISQLMWQMQLQQMIGGGVGDPTRDPFDYRTTNDNRDIVIPSGVPRWEGYSGTKSNTNISGEMMHPNAGGVFPQPRPSPAGDVVLPATEGGGIPYMPRVLPGGEDRRSGKLSQPSYSPGPYGSTRISDVRSDPVTQLMLQMQLRAMGGGQPLTQQGLPYEEDIPGISAAPGLAFVPSDNRDMQVWAPGQYEFPKLAWGSLLHPNAAGIYGGERPPPAGDVVLPRTAQPFSPAYMPQAAVDAASRNRNAVTQPSYLPGPGGGTRISDTGDPVTQLMMQMQLQQLMGGNRF